MTLDSNQTLIFIESYIIPLVDSYTQNNTDKLLLDTEVRETAVKGYCLINLFICWIINAIIS